MAREARLRDLRVKLLIGSSPPEFTAALAEELEALSVDVAGALSNEDIIALGCLPTVTTLLPGIAYHKSGIFPPGRELIDQNAAVCLATAFGPESCPSLSLPMMMALACREMRFTPEEAISACTLNAAVATGCPERAGSIEPGKRADLSVFNVVDYRQLPHYFGFNLCSMTMRQGKILYRGARLPPLPQAQSKKL